LLCEKQKEMELRSSEESAVVWARKLSFACASFKGGEAWSDGSFESQLTGPRSTRVRSTLAFAPGGDGDTTITLTAEPARKALGMYTYAVTYGTTTVRGAVWVCETDRERDVVCGLLESLALIGECADVYAPLRSRGVSLLRCELRGAHTVDATMRAASALVMREMSKVALELTELTVQDGKQSAGKVQRIALPTRGGSSRSPVAVRRVTSKGALAGWDVLYTATASARTVGYALVYGATKVGGGTVHIGTERPKPRAFVLSCMCHREEGHVSRLIRELGYDCRYDHISLAGASLGFVGGDKAANGQSTMCTVTEEAPFANREYAMEGTGVASTTVFTHYDETTKHWSSTLLDHIYLAYTLHKIDKIVVVDHLQCECYKAYYGRPYDGDDASSRSGSIKQHFTNLQNLCQWLGDAYHDDGTHISGHLMDVDGTLCANHESGETAARWKPRANYRPGSAERTSRAQSPTHERFWWIVASWAIIWIQDRFG
jgi:hypothetical protein